jgi:epoxyqueuosine reductase
VKSQPTAESAYTPRTGLYAPDLIPLLSLTEEEFGRRFRGSPIRRAKRRGLLRNVAVALGNSKSREALAPLIRALDEQEALVRGHVAWALGQIGSQQAVEALERRLSIEKDSSVRMEIEAALVEVTNSNSTEPRSPGRCES